MKKIIVIESAHELIDAFRQDREENEVAEIEIPHYTTLWVGRIKKNTIDMKIDNEYFQLVPGLDFEELFVALCQRAGIRLRRPDEID